jgi:hypothetical protein
MQICKKYMKNLFKYWQTVINAYEICVYENVWNTYVVKNLCGQIKNVGKYVWIGFVHIQFKSSDEFALFCPPFVDDDAVS